MADSETQQPFDTTQQVPSKTPTTSQKNPKHVAEGKADAAKTKQAREAQKKALAEAQVIIATISSNNLRLQLLTRQLKAEAKAKVPKTF